VDLADGYPWDGRDAEIDTAGIDEDFLNDIIASTNKSIAETVSDQTLKVDL